jgi:lipopolysaccharide transport system permease protein
MSAAYPNPVVTLDAQSRRAHAEIDVRNQSKEAWRPGEGFAVGYHLFDAATGTLIVDGPRVAPPADVPPGEAFHAAFEIEVPVEDGRYQVLLSPMREGACWYYERGWPFVLAEAVVEEGRVRLERVAVATRADLLREQRLRALGRAFTYPLLTIWRNRSLIRVMVRRDVLGRYRGSFGGSFWTVFNPLLLMVTYFFVFALVLRARFPGDPSRAGFALNFLAGMLPWLAFSEAVGRAPSVLLEHRNFVRKLVFPVETLPVDLVAAGLVSEFFGIILYTLFVLAVRHHLPATVLWLPALLAPQILFTAGAAWFLAALGVFVRDLGQVLGFLLTIWFFITPICYPEASWPDGVAPLLSKNPILVLVRGYRAIFLEGHAPAFGPLWKLWALSLVLFIAGHAWFYKLRKSFADMI